MDIRSKAVEPTSVLHLRDADDELLFDEKEPKQPITVTLYGPGSKPYAKAQAANHNRMVDKLKRKGKTDQTAEQKAKETAEFLTGCTKEFSDNFQYGELRGEAMHLAVYADITIGFIAEQVNKHLGDWANFTKASTSSSPSSSGTPLG